MLKQFSLPIVLMGFFYLYLEAITQLPNCTNTTEVICDGNLPCCNNALIKYECSAELFSSVELQSCANGQYNDILFWYWYDSICPQGSVLGVHFAIVFANNTSTCLNTSKQSVTYHSCENNYIFSWQSMIIKNITNSSLQGYVCFPGRDQLQISFVDGIVHSIQVIGKISYMSIQQDLIKKKYTMIYL